MPDDPCEALAAASRDWAGAGPTGEMLTATRSFLAGALEDPSLLGRLAASLHRFEPGAAAWAAVVCGMVVERGAVAEHSGPPILELLRSWLPRLPKPPADEESGDGSEPAPLTAGQTKLLALFRYLCQSSVTHLARLPALREVLVSDAALLERLGELQGFSPGAVWVSEALLKSSGILVLLHPSGGAGLRLVYANVSNCFHLFTLLQTAVGTRLPGGRTTDEDLARQARGKATGSRDDEAWWHYGSALSAKPDIKASIWGEGTVREIPRVDGLPVILAWPPILQTRTWAAGFLGPNLEAMPADVMIERDLTSQEVQEWLAKLKIRPQGKWWKFW